MNNEYKEDQFVNTVKSHESNQSGMIQQVRQVTEELNQSNENSETKNKGIQCIKPRLGQVIKEQT